MTTDDEKLDALAEILTAMTTKLVVIGSEIGASLPPKAMLKLYIESTGPTVAMMEANGAEAISVDTVAAGRVVAHACLAFIDACEQGYEAIRQKRPDSPAIQYAERMKSSGRDEAAQPEG